MPEFAEVLEGLMRNRHLTARAVCRASLRAESTINQLLAGTLLPHADLVKRIAPVLGMETADLLVIAGLPVEPEPVEPKPDAAWARKIGTLVTVAHGLTPAQVAHLIEVAEELGTENERTARTEP